MSKQQGTLRLEELRGSIAVVTGAGNNGIGWGLCCHAAGTLDMHVIAIDLHESLVDTAQQRLRELYPSVEIHGLVCDVTKPDQLRGCVDKIAQLLPDVRIGAVFANAGVIFNHTLLKSTAAEWATTLNVNVIGVVNTIQAFVPLLQSHDAPSVFSATASIGGLVRGDGGGAAYQASKHAVVAISESLSFELARKSPQIRVHVLCPCIVASGLDKSSRVNMQVSDGAKDAAELEAVSTSGFALAMTPERHAEQVFDQIAAGNFYMVTDNVRPYVDHDRPFDGMAIVRERFDNLMELTIDNADAFIDRPGLPPTSILKGPMFVRTASKES